MYTVGTHMYILIDPTGQMPIYEQIAEQIADQIRSGALPENSRLPSIRGLAKDLQVSLMTTKKAYEKLEAGGAIYTVPGKGCFVSKRDTARIRSENLEKITALLTQTARLAAQAGISTAEITTLYTEIDHGLSS